GELAMGVDAKGAVQGRCDLRAGDGARLGPKGELIRFADDAAPLDGTAAEDDRPDAGVMIAAAGGVDLRRAPEFAQAGNHRVRKEAAIVQVLEQGAVGAIEIRDDL